MQRNSQMKRYIGQGMWKRAQSFPVLTEYTSLPVPACVHPPGSSPNPVPLG